jgi:hypothetical protein
MNTCTTTAAATMTTTNCVSAMEKEKHRQLTMKYLMILLLLSKHNVLISSRTMNCNVNSRTTRNKQWQNMMFKTEVN